MAAVMEEEKALIETQRSLIVRRRQLRDPVELAIQARARGFRPLSVVRSLPDPRIPGVSGASPAPGLPPVAAKGPEAAAGGGWR